MIMKLFLLPGNTHRSWAENLEKTLPDKFETHVQSYRHLNTGEYLIDMEHEVDVLKKSAGTGKYSIVGKSAGALLAIKGTSEGKLHPEKCIFMGLPINWAKDQDFDLDKWLEKFSVNSMFIQQEHDKYGSFTQLSNLLKEKSAKNFELVKLHGNDHKYDNFTELKKLILEFLAA